MFLKKKKKKALHPPDFPQMSDVSYREVLSEIQHRKKVARYLEIGSRTGDSISKIDCSYVAVDPEFNITAPVFNQSSQMLFFQQTSDDFFASKMLEKMDWVPDLAFIDGMHIFEFALRDFMNAEKTMQPDGVICIHDICPFNYEMTSRDVGSLDRISAWTGDVWKVVLALLETRKDLQVEVVAAARTGLACISKLDPTNTALEDSYEDLLRKYTDIDLLDIGATGFYDRFNLVDPKDYISRL